MKSRLQIPSRVRTGPILSPSSSSSVGFNSSSNNNGKTNNNNNHTPLNTMKGPPLTEIVATPQEERRTHIEVCVRIRPLVVNKQSSTSFLKDSPAAVKQQSSSSSRRSGIGSGIPRPGSRLSPPRTGLRPPSSSRTTAPPPLAPTPDATTTPQQHVEGDESDETYAWSVASQDTIQMSSGIENLPGRTDSYTLDHVYGPDNTTQDLYDRSVGDLVRGAMDGFHASVLAYGQTSTGKTHTMTGTAQQPGLIPLAIRGCFDYLKRLSHPREYLLRLSYMEVYKEHIRDLLAEQQTPIRLFETTADGLVIKGLKEEVVTSPEDVFRILAEGESRRQVGATTMNAHSSRSHVIVRLWIESRALPAGEAASGGQRFASSASTTSSLASSSRLGANVRVSSLSLVDLAGSESVRLTGNNERRQEGHYINQSLMTLGKVVYALSEAGDGGGGAAPKKKIQQHIPYRDSKLTRLLQPSLSGNAQVVLVCCISPLQQHMEESHNTFKFAVRAKRIPQKATIQETHDDERTLLQSYRDEIEALKQQLQEAQAAQQQSPAAATAAPVPSHFRSPATANDNNNSMSLADDVVSEDEIKELVSSIQTMEKLILKSKPISPHIPQRAEDLLDADDWDVDDGEEDEEDLIALATTKSEGATTTTTDSTLQTPVRPPPQEDDTDKNLEIELSRIQGLLGSVLKKRKQQQKAGAAAAAGNTPLSSINTIASSSSVVTSNSDREVLHLRAQLEQQEMASTIRKADSTFLQKQLEEKDDLLMEVSKILEAVEQRQVQLEAENVLLKKENQQLRAAAAATSSSSPRRGFGW